MLGPRARVCRGHLVGGVAREEGSEEKLPAEQGELVLDRQHLRLVVEMVHRRHEDGPRSDSEGGTLDGLEGIERAGAGIREPNGGGIIG